MNQGFEEFREDEDVIAKCDCGGNTTKRTEARKRLSFDLDDRNFERSQEAMGTPPS